MVSKQPVAVVVGVGPGLGAALARRFAAGGYSIGLVSRRETNLKPVEKQLEEKGYKALSVTGDAGDLSSIKNALKTIRDKFNKDPEVLLYNASRIKYAGILDMKPEGLQAALNVTVVGGLAASQQVLPSMMKNKKGTIIFTGATASVRGAANFGGFAATKFALRALAQSMAREFHPQGIHIAHVIVDGQINTPHQVQNQPEKNIQSFLDSDAIAETYWQLHVQHPSAWTHELDLRPATEKF